MGACVKINIFLIVFVVIVGIILKYLPSDKESKLSNGYSQNTVLNFTEVTAKNEYSSEEHMVVTEDGYILTIFRIAKARNCHHKKKIRPVLIMHGFLENSDIFLDAGPTAGLAYLLSDSCYDVWVGNKRGNNYGRKHLRLNPDKDVEFWEFSVDEMGFYDVPATIDYILKQTGADKINYIGFSQGCAVYFLMCSERPDYCQKTAVMIALAPAVILNETESLPLRFLFRSALYFKTILNTVGVHEVFRKGGVCQQFLEYLCQITGSTWTEMLCGTCAYLDNYRLGTMTPDTQQLVFSHFYVGTSLNIMARYGQILASGKFQKFDYGETMNLKRYGKPEVPEYNLRAVSTPVVIIQGQNDKLVSVKDVRIVSKKLPNVLEMVEVSDSGWTHFDMLYHMDIKKMIYPKIYEYLEKYRGKDI